MKIVLETNVITFLGDVSLLDPSITCEYKMNKFIFNLEYVITDNRSTPKQNKVNLCGERINFADIFKKNPLAVNLANNHIMDYGNIGFRDTLEHLDKYNIKRFGAGEHNDNYGNPLIIEVDKRKIGLIGYSMFNEHTANYGVSYFSKEKAAIDLKYVTDYEVDSIIVNIHWGIEQDPYFTYEQREIGRFLIDNGANLVIGHHPHCLQPFERYKGKYIFYSLGNCIFPNFEVNAFFDENGISKRTHRKRQLRLNRESYAVNFNISKNEVISIEKLVFKNNSLKKISDISLNKKFKKMIINHKTLTKLRKRLIFIYSNSFVENKVFDFNAIRHEIKMKREKKNESIIY